MWQSKHVSLVFPTYNEKDSIKAAINEFLASGYIDEIVVVNNNAAAGTDEEVAQTVDPAASLSPLDSRKHVRDTEIYYGKLGVLAEEAEQLFHGKPLAKIIAVGSVLTATGLFLFAVRLSD